MSRRLHVILSLAVLALSAQVPLFGACPAPEAVSSVAAILALTPLEQSPVLTSGPGPDCGPTREWNCVTPGCPDCPEYLFEGTVCEKNQYEKQTGRVCSPA